MSVIYPGIFIWAIQKLTSAITMRKSSHAKPALVILLAQHRSVTPAKARTIRTMASAYILPGDSFAERTEAILDEYSSIEKRITDVVPDEASMVLGQSRRFGSSLDFIQIPVFLELGNPRVYGKISTEMHSLK